MTSRSLSARSVVASTLLGTVPPRLPGRLLVAFAELFDISEGATRVALSRMVERGELVNHHGTYALAGSLVHRQARQAGGLHPSTRPWDGSWELYVVEAGGRAAGERAALRRAFGHLGLFERREGVWLRPDNLDPARLPEPRGIVAAQARRFLARPDEDPRVLAAALFDFGSWARRADVLEARMETTTDVLDRDGPATLASGFALAADVLRHLLADPLFPASVVPEQWSPERLRERYARYDRRYRAELEGFFAAGPQV